MCVQLDLSVISRGLQKHGIPFAFLEFWSEEVNYKNYSKKKSLMFECYNLMDPMEQQVAIF
jgi:hypothetical protein